MKEKITKEQILEFFEKESGDRILDRVEYAERVIFPAMERYARQFLNPIVADNIFELIGMGFHKINRCEMTVGGLADQVEHFINQEVERRIKERMPSEEEINKQAEQAAQRDTKDGRIGIIIDSTYYGVFCDALEWLRSRLTNPESSQKTEGGGE